MTIGGVKLFLAAINDLELDDNERNRRNAKKYIEVLNNVTDISNFEPLPDAGIDILNLYLRIQWLFEMRNKSSVVWPCISFLTRIIGSATSLDIFKSSENIRIFMRDHWAFPSSLTHLLEAHFQSEHLSSILELIRRIIYGISITREEAYLYKLLKILIRIFSAGFSKNFQDESESVQISVICILSSICNSGNLLACQILLRVMSNEERSQLFSFSNTDARIEILLHSLVFGLNRLNLSSGVFSNGYSDEQYVNETFLTKICDAFCAAYGDDDRFLLGLLVDFLDRNQMLTQKGMSSGKFLYSSLLSLIQQIFVVTCFSEGCNVAANELVFKFVRSLLSHLLFAPTASELYPFAEAVVKTVMFRLDAASPLGSFQALQLLKHVLCMTIATAMDSGDDSPQTNLRCHLDHILPKICHMVLQIQDCSAVSILWIIAECGVKTFLQLNSNLRPADLFDVIMANAVVQGKRRFVVNASLLCNMMAENENIWLNQGDDDNDRIWTKVVDQIIKNEHVNDCLVREINEEDSGKRNSLIYALLNRRPQRRQLMMCINNDEVESGTQNPNHSNWINKMNSYSEALGKDQDCTVHKDDEVREPVLPLYGCFHSPFLDKETDLRLHTTLQRLDKIIHKESLDTGELDISTILDLGNMRLSSHINEGQLLRDSVAASDQRIKVQNQQLSLLQTEIWKLSDCLQKMTDKFQQSKTEAENLKTQYFQIISETSIFREETMKDCEYMTSKIHQMEDENEKMTENAMKYKQQINGLQRAIEEHQICQQKLQKSLKSEAQTNSDLVLALGKSEEKLRKMDHRLQEEIACREKAERDFASQQALTKRQEQALAKKEKQIQDQNAEIEDCRRIQDAIFNLSKNKKTKS